MSIGVRSRVFRRSEIVDGDSVAIGELGYDDDGIKINDRRDR